MRSIHHKKTQTNTNSSEVQQSAQAVKQLYEAGAHIVLLKGKVAFAPEWEKTENAAKPKAAEAWLSGGNNIGLIPASLDLVVVDFDAPDGVTETAITDALGEPLARIPSQTPGRAHYYYRKPKGDVGNQRWQGGDIRCSAGYVVLWEPASVAAILPNIANAECVDLDQLPAERKWRELRSVRGDEAPEDAPQVDATSAADLVEGARNTTLTSLAGRYRREGCAHDELAALLQVDNIERCKPPLTRTEVAGIAASIAAKPRGYPHNDTGNGLLILDRAHDDWRFDHKRKRWLAWSNARRRWEIDVTERSLGLAKRAVRRRIQLAERSPSQDHDAEVKWGKRSLDHTRLTNALKMARIDAPISDDGEGWDRRPDLLGVANGVLDLQNGELREGERDDRLTAFSPVAYDAAAKAPVFQKFLKRVQPDPEVRRYLRHMAGYFLTGSVEEQAMFFWHGQGANGKSTMAEVLCYVLGGQLATASAPKLLTMTRFEPHPTALAALEGKRLVVSAELDTNSRLNEGLLKQLTGGDLVMARRMREDFEEPYTPSAKFVLYANHRPGVRDQTDAMWRRVRLVPWTVKLPESERDKTLLDKLKVEAPGILAWMVRGLREWRSDGLQEPEQVTEATKSYRDEVDPLAGFLRGCCVIGDNAGFDSVGADALSNAYKKWCAAQGVASYNRPLFYTMLEEHGFMKSARSAKGYSFKGLRT